MMANVTMIMRTTSMKRDLMSLSRLLWKRLSNTRRCSCRYSTISSRNSKMRNCRCSMSLTSQRKSEKLKRERRKSGRNWRRLLRKTNKKLRKSIRILLPKSNPSKNAFRSQYKRSLSSQNTRPRLVNSLKIQRLG
jgi:hypothetical protein